MSKFKNELVTDMKKKEHEKKEQMKLHQKYHVEKDDVFVVEKTNTIKFLIRVMGHVVHIGCTIMILFLAVVGLMALIYPDSRAILGNQWEAIINQMQELLGIG